MSAPSSPVLVLVIAAFTLAACQNDYTAHSKIGCTEHTARLAGDAFAFCMAAPRRQSSINSWDARVCGESAFAAYCIVEKKQ